MKFTGVYSLKLERLSTEQQHSVIRVLLSLITSLVLFKFYNDHPKTDIITSKEIYTISIVFFTYSLAILASVKILPHRINLIMLASTVIEIFLITYLVSHTIKTGIPFHLWYIFYVVNVATRYGWQISVLALSASIVSFTAAYLIVYPYSSIDISFTLGFTGFLLVLAFMFGQISERQHNYQASLAIVNEFRAELAGLATSKEVIEHLISRATELLNVKNAFFLPAKRGADASEAPGLRSSGTDPVMLSTFRESGGTWNVEEVIKEQRPIFSNNTTKDHSLHLVSIRKLGLRNLAAVPMMVRSTPVGVLYVTNRKDKGFTSYDIMLLELIATQAAPVIENALLWERLREAAASEERLRIARDLHDNFLQTLAAIKLHLERCKILIEKDSPKAVDCIERIHDISTRGLAEVRSYLTELRIVGPDPTRFNQTIKRCVSESAAKGKFETTLDINLPNEGIHPEVALAAFHIVRELLNNAATHSKATNVNIKLYIENEKLYIEVEDNGIGFEVARVRAEKASEGHLGLVGVDERARQTKGSVTITSSPGKGTHTLVQLSLV